jgi:SAM-dependent methyltransferase
MSTDAASQISETGHFTGDNGAGAKSSVIASIIGDLANRAHIQSILVVGCGQGEDARSLAAHFAGATVDAIDNDDYFTGSRAGRIRFFKMDACELTYPDRSFDLVYSFHALEHIPDYRRAISEMRRVLKPGGFYCIGTPNRTRLAGYIGVPGYSFSEKLRSNARDWGQRLAGRFRNEFGAHAGYTARELLSICSAIGPGNLISDLYYTRLYASRRRIISTIRTLGLGWCAWPSVYVLGTK